LHFDWYDYGARFYDPAVCRWLVPEPKAESYYHQTLYLYAGNNPILFVDFDGNDYGVTIDQGQQKTITISAHYLANSKSIGLANRATNDINSLSGKYVFVSGGKSAMKSGSAEKYTVNFNLTTDIAEGSQPITDPETGNIVSQLSQTDVAAWENESGVVNGFNIVGNDNTDKAGGADSKTIDVEESSSSSTTMAIHEIGHTLGMGHSNGVMKAVGATGNRYTAEQVAEILTGVNIGGSVTTSDDRPGKGRLFGNQSNTGLESGKVMSMRKYNRLSERYERRRNRRDEDK